MKIAYEPIMICQCGTSFHRNAMAAHERQSHNGSLNPAEVRLGTKDEHAKAGWDVSDYPARIYC